MTLFINVPAHSYQKKNSKNYNNKKKYHFTLNNEYLHIKY